MYKILPIFTFLAFANAVPVENQATSYSYFNDNLNSIHHFDSAASSFNKYAAAPAPHVYNAPAAPTVYQAVPKHSYVSAPKYSYAPIPVSSAAKAAVPVVSKYAAPVTKYVAYDDQKEEYAPVQYEFAYNIEDAHTGDFHSQEEHREGDHVVGQYSLHEADGAVRIVKYSDDGHGFNAIVEKQGHPTEAPASYKKIVAAAPAYYHH